MSEKEFVSRTMTVARILGSGGEPGGVEVVFLESAMFFRLARENPAFYLIIAALRSALKNGSQVEVRLDSVGSDVIEDVRVIN